MLIIFECSFDKNLSVDLNDHILTQFNAGHVDKNSYLIFRLTHMVVICYFMLYIILFAFSMVKVTKVISQTVNVTVEYLKLGQEHSIKFIVRNFSRLVDFLCHLIDILGPGIR